MASRRRGKGRRKVGRKTPDAQPDPSSQEIKSCPPFFSLRRSPPTSRHASPERASPALDRERSSSSHNAPPLAVYERRGCLFCAAAWKKSSRGDLSGFARSGMMNQDHRLDGLRNRHGASHGTKRRFSAFDATTRRSSPIRGTSRIDASFPGRLSDQGHRAGRSRLRTAGGRDGRLSPAGALGPGLLGPDHPRRPPHRTDARYQRADRRAGPDHLRGSSGNRGVDLALLIRLRLLSSLPRTRSGRGLHACWHDRVSSLSTRGMTARQFDQVANLRSCNQAGRSSVQISFPPR